MKQMEVKTLFQILDESGKKVGVINVPMCGIQEIKGFTAPGFLSKNEGMLFPKEIREKIRRKFNITNQAVNLATFLQSSMWEGS